MQTLARDGLTEDQARFLLSGDPRIVKSQGCDLLDTANQYVADLTPAMRLGGEVTHDNTVTGDQVARKCQLSLTRTLAWGRDRVRPYVVHSHGGLSARFDQGVFVLTTPQSPSGESPATYNVQGYDLTSVLGDQVGDTYVIPAGQTYLAALRQVVADSGVGAQVLLDGTAQDTPMPYTMVWALYDGGPSWLTICNDLLSPLAYRRLYGDELGNFRSGPKVPLVTAAPGWSFDVREGAGNRLVLPGWTRDEDLWAAPNVWTFVRTNTADPPTEANGGIYRPPPNQSDGPSSIDSIGRRRPKTVYLDAADTTSFRAQADAMVAADKAAGTQIQFQAHLPVAGDSDVVGFVSDGRSDKLPVASWTTNLDGSPGAWVAEDVPAEPAAALQASATGLVTQASTAAGGLRVVVDGATVDSPANSLDGAAYTLGDRVNVTVRNPVQPLVNGVETTT